MRSFSARQLQMTANQLHEARLLLLSSRPRRARAMLQLITQFGMTRDLGPASVSPSLRVRGENNGRREMLMGELPAVKNPVTGEIRKRYV